MARSLFVVLLLSLSGIAAGQGKGFDYNFIELSYSNAEYDNQNTDGDGLGISASFAVSNNLHIFGGWKAGGGINMPISKLMDVVVQGFYQTTKIGLPGGGSVDNDGLGLRAGVRVGANQWVELFGGLTYADLDSGNETTLDAGFLFNLSDAFAVGVSGAWDDEFSIWSINGRLYFN